MDRRSSPGNSPDDAALRERLIALEQENESLRRQLAERGQPWRAFDACLEGTLIHEDGVIRYVNPALLRQFGYDRAEELVGREGWELFPLAADVPMLRERTARIVAGELVPLSPIWYGRRKDGSLVPIQSKGTRVEWEGRPAVLSLYLDMTDRVRAEEALAASERRFRKLVENAQDAFTLYGPDTALLFESAAGYRILGEDPGSHLDIRGIERIHPDDVAQASRIHEALLQRPDEPAVGVQFRVRHADGTWRWLEFDARNLLGDPDVGGILVNWRDVTARRAAEDAMRRHVAFRDALIGTAGEGIGVCFAIDQPPYVAFSIWNDRMTELTGYSMEEVNARGWYQTMYPDAEQCARAVERMARMREGDDLRQEEWTITRKDGARRTLAISTSVVETADGPAVVALMSDVTARREAEEALRDREERLRVALESAGMISYAVDLPSGQVVFSAGLNEPLRAAVEAGGRPEDFMQLVHPDDREPLLAEIQRVQRHGGEARVEFRATVPAADGGVAWYVTRVCLVPGGSGRPARLYGVTTDITTRKRAEQERTRLEEKLRQAQHLESLGVLAGGIAHDFNNLLTTVLGYAGLCRDQAPADSPVAEYLRQIEHASRRAADLCQQMLAYAGKGTFAMGPIDLGEAARETAGQMRAPLPPKARLSLHLDPSLPPVQADPVQVRQAIVNLLTNAAEALGDDGGEVVVRARRELLAEPRLHLLTRAEGAAPGDYVVLEVSDTGSGMSEEVKARIFEPFFTTKFTGRGLGLSAVLGIVRGHKGALEVSSAPGRGSAFRLYFPVATATKAPAPRALVPREGLVLVAEDEPGIRRLTDQLLSDLGLSVRTAADGREAVEVVAAGPGEFRLALVDLTMPEMDGAAVARALRALAPALPVVLMSGYSVAEVRDRVAGDNVVGLLQKPFTKAELVEVISRALAR